MIQAWQQNSNHGFYHYTNNKSALHSKTLTCSVALRQWFWQSPQDSAPQGTCSCLACWCTCCPVASRRLSSPDTRQCLKVTMIQSVSETSWKTPWNSRCLKLVKDTMTQSVSEKRKKKKKVTKLFEKTQWHRQWLKETMTQSLSERNDDTVSERYIDHTSVWKK